MKVTSIRVPVHIVIVQANDEIKCNEVSTIKRSRPVKEEDEDGYTATRQKAATTEWLADDKRRVRSPVINWLSSSLDPYLSTRRRCKRRWTNTTIAFEMVLSYNIVSE